MKEDKELSSFIIIPGWISMKTWQILICSCCSTLID